MEILVKLLFNNLILFVTLFIAADIPMSNERYKELVRYTGRVISVAFPILLLLMVWV